MKSEQPTPSPLQIAEVSRQVRPNCPDAVIEAIAGQLTLAREARARVVREGSVVRDPKGSVVAHPAIKVEADAIKFYAGLLQTWGRR
jgi:hypothetical protein